MFINPIVTIIAVCSLFIQISNATALSILGLASQAFVFALVALSWTARVRFPTLDRISLSRLITWYQLVGWATVDNAVFSIIQLILFYVARHRQRGSSISADQEPLLDHVTVLSYEPDESRLTDLLRPVTRLTDSRDL